VADNRATIYFDAEDRTGAAFASMRQSFAELDRRVLGFGEAFKGAFAGLTVFAGLREISGYTAKIISFGASLDDMSEKTSLSVETLDRLSQVATIGGHSMDDLVSSTTKFALRFSEAFSGSSKDSVAIFRALGIETRTASGGMRDLDSALLETVTKLATAENKTLATAYAQKVLNKSAADLIPFMRDLQETQNLQSRFTAESAAEAEKLTKEWGRLKLEAETLGIRLAQGLVPALKGLAQSMREVSQGRFIGQSWGESIETVRRRIEMLRREEPGPKAQGFGELFGSDFRGNWKAQLDAQEAKLKRLQQLQREAVLADTGDVADPRDIRARRPAAPVELPPLPSESPPERRDRPRSSSPALDRGRAEAKEFRDSWVKAIDDVISEEKRLAEALTPRSMAETQADSAKLAAAEADRLRRVGAQWKAAVDPMSEYTARLKDLSEISRDPRAYGMDGFDVTMARLKAATEYEEQLARTTGAIPDATKAAAQGFREFSFTAESAFERVVLEGGKASDVIRGLGQDLLRISLRKMVTEPMVAGASKAIPPMLSGAGAWFADLLKRVPKFAEGTDYVPRTGLALVHEGERIVPAAENAGRRGGVTIQQTVNISAGVAGTVAAEIARMLPAIKAETVAAVADARMRGVPV
jgi:hypothetical protein